MTQIGLLFGILLAGAVVIETVFQWPGIGTYAFEAILHSDYAAVMGFTVYAGVVFMRRQPASSTSATRSSTRAGAPA